MISILTPADYFTLHGWEHKWSSEDMRLFGHYREVNLFSIRTELRCKSSDSFSEL